MEPVVIHPTIDQWIHRHDHLQCRVRIDERHQGQEPIVGDAEDADPAVCLRGVLHQPVDGVVCVGGVIHRRRVQWPVYGPAQHVVAFRAVLAAHVLIHADVAAFDNHLPCVEIDALSKMGAGIGTRHHAGVVGRARKQDRCVLCPTGHKDDRVQLYTVAHRDHYLAFDKVKAVGGGLELGRRLARQGRVCGGRRCCRGFARSSEHRFRARVRRWFRLLGESYPDQPTDCHQWDQCFHGLAPFFGSTEGLRLRPAPLGVQRRSEGDPGEVCRRSDSCHRFSRSAGTGYSFTTRKPV